MIRLAFAVIGIGALFIVLGAMAVLAIVSRAPEGFEDEQGYHSGATPPMHPSV
jgi:hypothetical protein